MTRKPAADPLSAVIERTTSALAEAQTDSTITWHFVRSWLLINRYDHDGAATGDLDQAYQEFLQLP